MGKLKLLPFKGSFKSANENIQDLKSKLSSSPSNPAQGCPASWPMYIDYLLLIICPFAAHLHWTSFFSSTASPKQPSPKIHPYSRKNTLTPVELYLQIFFKVRPTQGT